MPGQVVVIVQIFVILGQSLHPLGNQIRPRVFDQVGVLQALKAAGESPMIPHRFSVSRRSRPSASEVMFPPSNLPTTFRRPSAEIQAGLAYTGFHRAVSFKWLKLFVSDFLCHKVTAFSGSLAREAGRIRNL